MKIFQKNFLARHLVIAALTSATSLAYGQVSISIDIAPPPLQVYEQPACPDDGYIWTPGYWAYDRNAYYWVPGSWVQPPEVGLLWTPPYWGWDGRAYAFHPGYWGQNVGYYGGIDYGYGYGGRGYGGGRWEGGHFSYNTAVNNVGSIHAQHTYADRTAANRQARSVSYNGGKGGAQAQPTALERQFSHQRHTQPTATGQTPVRAASQSQPNGANGSFTGESVKPQPQQVNPRPEAIVHPETPAATQPKIEPQKEMTQMQPPAQKQQPSAPAQAPHPQGQPKPKPAPHPAPQAAQQHHDEKPSAQPDKKSDQGQNNAPNH